MTELPLDIWKSRIKNELKSLERLRVLEKENIIFNDNYVEFVLNIDTLGFTKKHNYNSNELIPQRNHRIMLKLNRSFPYPGGVDFAWYSEIFHPNIHPMKLPSGEMGTGYICLNLLKKWSNLSDLEITVKALKMLIDNPNPDDPLNYPMCTDAAEFFRNNSMADLKEKYKVEEIKIEDKDDDDIIIIDD